MRAKVEIQVKPDLTRDQPSIETEPAFTAFPNV